MPLDRAPERARPAIRPMGDAEKARIVSTLTSAFIADPVVRWMYPAPADYFAGFPRFIEAFGAAAFEHKTIWRLEDFSAAALWMAPGAAPDDNAVIDAVMRTVVPERHEDFFTLAEAMDAHHPAYPHWYLPWFGVDAPHQNRGRGRALLAHCLAMVDEQRLPAYLESPNPRNVPFYARHGFRVVGEARAGACPPVTFMLREAHVPR